MKKILIALLTTSALGLGSYTYAQTNGDANLEDSIPAADDRVQEHRIHEHNNKHKKKHLKRMEIALGLSFDQVEAIKALHEQARADRPEREPRIHIQQLNPNAADYYEVVADIAAKKAAQIESSIVKRAELHASVFAILTPEQQEKALELIAERKARKTKSK